MRKCILITHQFILDGETWKPEVFDFCVKHYRKYNPDAYIIITGHGNLPLRSTLDMCDWYYWSSEIISGEIDRGHPRLVTIGLNHAKDMGMQYVCKTRLDTVNMMSDVAGHCHDILLESKKLLLNTHYYNHQYLLMDLFMYSDVDTQLKLFNPNKWDVPWCADGTGPVAKNYIEDVNHNDIEMPFNLNFFERQLNQNIVFRNPSELRWLDFRKHNTELSSISDKLVNNTLDNFENYLWIH